MNSEVYQVFQISDKFWESYWDENENINLRQFVIVAANEFNVPLSILNKLAITCKYFFLTIEWRILSSKALYNKWAGLFGRALCARAVSHPLTYTDDVVRVVPILEMGYGTIGLRVLDVDNLFDQSYSGVKRFAFTNISFLTYDKTPFVVIVFVLGEPVFTLQVTSDDYVDLGELSRDMLKTYEQNPMAMPGRYLINLNLPTRFNPIVLGAPLIPPNRISFCIASEWSTYHYGGLDISDVIFNVHFVADNFTHAIINFKMVNENDYDWSKYRYTFPTALADTRISSLIQKFG